MINVDHFLPENDMSEELPIGEERVALMTELGMSEDEMRSLEVQAEAQRRAFDAVEDRPEAWVSFNMRTGELGLGNDDYDTLITELIRDHGVNYCHIFSIIGPN